MRLKIVKIGDFVWFGGTLSEIETFLWDFFKF